MDWIPKDRPPIAWTLWERVRSFGSVGLAGAVVLVALELLMADIPNESAHVRGRGASSGVPLWPIVRALALALPLASVTAACLLPLYRYRHGAIAVGAVAGFVLGAVLILVPGFGTWDLASIAGWQRVAGFVLFTGLGAVFSSGNRDEVLYGGPPKPESGPPVT